MIVLVLALWQAGCRAAPENPLHPPLLFLARHQREDGSWGPTPEGCRCSPPLSVDRRIRMEVDLQVRREFAILLVQLEHDESIAREEAQRAILRLGAPAVPLLQAGLRHPVLEVADRCRDTLHRLIQTSDEVRAMFGGDAATLGTTSLALLAFLGSGYGPFSKYEVWDPILSRAHSFDRVTKKAVLWILEKQKEDGSFSPDPVANVLTALAISELYGMTGEEKYSEPAQKAFESVLASRCTDRSFLIWKGVLLQVLRSDRTRLKELGQLLAQDESIPGRFGSLLLLRLGKTPDSLLPRIPELTLDDLSPEEIWIATTAAYKIWSRRSSQWRTFREEHLPRIREYARNPTCERGTMDAVQEDRIRTAAFKAFLVQRFYEYPNALLASPDGN